MAGRSASGYVRQMYYSDWTTIPYLALMAALFIGAIVLIVLLARLMHNATRALQSYRRVQELKIELLIAGDEDGLLPGD